MASKRYIFRHDIITQSRGLLWLTSPTHALNLAIFRIVTCIVWLFMVKPFEALYFVGVPSSLSQPTGFWGVLRDAGVELPRSSEVVVAASVIFVIATLLAMVGWRARWMLGVVLVTGGLVLTIPQVLGRINHCNHLVFATILLIASPCDHALSLRRTGRSGNGAMIDIAYALPLRFMAVLLAIAYFFPGYWKVDRVGSYWMTPTNFIHTLDGKWHELGGWIPMFRVDKVRWLCAVLATGTIVFEVGWWVLLLGGPKCRAVAAFVASSFHIGTFVLMRINFLHMVACQVVLIDWHAMLARVRGDSTPRVVASGPTRFRGSVIPTVIVGVILVGAQVFEGITRRDDWPLGCYPTFARRATGETPVLIARVTMRDGSTRLVRESTLHSVTTSARARVLCNRAWSLPDREQRLTDLWIQFVRVDPTLLHARRIEFYVRTESTCADTMGNVIGAEELIFTLTPK